MLPIYFSFNLKKQSLILSNSKNHIDVFTHMTVLWLITWGCNSVLVCGLVVAKGQEQRLDGANENSSQAAVEDYIKDEDFYYRKRKE